MAEETRLIEVIGLKKYFPIRAGLFKRAVGAVKAVDDVSIYINRGETLGLVGESGCGKTTVGRAILMLAKPTDGYVFFETPTEVVSAFKNLHDIVTSVPDGKMTALDAVHLADAMLSLFGMGQCEIPEKQKRSMCQDADKLRKAARKYQTETDPFKHEDDARDLARDGIEDVAKRYCINYKRKREVRRLRSRIQFVFQDPFSSLDPKLLIKGIVSEPIINQNRYWPRMLESDRIRKRIQAVKENIKDQGPGGAGPEASQKELADLEKKLAKAEQSERLTRSQKRMSREEIRQQTIRLLEKVGLNVEHMYRFPHEFSGGQRQRIGVARALSVNPDFIVLDEPTSALDVSVQAQILNQLNALQKDFGLTYLFISHDLSVVRYMCDRVAVMYLGKIAEYASKDELFARPTHPYTEALLSVIPVPDPDLKRDRIILPGDVPSPANPPDGCRFHTRCPLVIDICHTVDPPLTDRGNRHFVACHVR